MIIKMGHFFFRWRDTIFSFFILFGLYLLTLNQEYWFNARFGHMREDIIFSILGFLFIFIGIIIRSITIGFFYIKRAGINKKIHAEKLFTEGLFSHSRNPLYLGNLFIVTGAVLSFNLYLFWFFMLPLFYFIYYAMIRAEENFLYNKFQGEYINYMQKVPRLFFGNFHLFPKSFEKLTFSFKRIVKVEHSVQFLVFFITSLINLFKFHFRYHFRYDHVFFFIIYFFIIILILYQIISNQLKKLGKLDTPC